MIGRSKDQYKILPKENKVVRDKVVASKPKLSAAPKLPSPASSLEDDTDEEEEEEEEEEEVAKVKAGTGKSGNDSYKLLLQTLMPLETLQSQNGRQTKRRKLEHLDNGVQTEEPPFEEEANDFSISNVTDDHVGSEDENEDEDDSSSDDPFCVHFEDSDSKEYLSEKINAIKNDQWKTERIDVPIKMSVTYPNIQMEVRPQSMKSLTKYKTLKDVNLKKKLADPVSRIIPHFDTLQSQLASPIFNYSDVIFGGRTPHNADSIRNLTCLHALNHIFKTRDRVMKTNARIAQNPDLEIRDQGFTRPKILFLLETRQSCVRYMDTITSLCDPEQQENKKRFQDAFVRLDDDFGKGKPPDFLELFEGNEDNEFRLGVKFTRKTLKYYSKFYNSDIIIASPLGLRRAVKADDPKSIDYDFLSSIEILIVDQVDAMLMQNWEHVEFVFEHLNRQTKEAHGCDFSRVRQWYLDQQAKYLRQTLVFSAYITPELNNLFNSRMLNVAGKVKYFQYYDGRVLDNQIQIRQTFYRFKSTSPMSEPDDRFKYFTTAILPTMIRQAEATPDIPLGTLIFVPSYLDFARIRNYFASSLAAQNISFGTVSEYGKQKEIDRARSHFMTGRYSVLLYTGRAHHFRRHNIRGVKSVVLYGLPENPIFYKELIGGFLGDSIEHDRVQASEAFAKVMFSVWDSLSLERIVGTERVARMLKERGGDTFDFR